MSPSKEFDVLLSNEIIGPIGGYSDPWQHLFFYRADWERGGLCLASLPLTVRHQSNKLEVYMTHSASPSLTLTPGDRAAALQQKEKKAKTYQFARDIESARVWPRRSIQFGSQPEEAVLPTVSPIKVVAGDYEDNYPPTPGSKRIDPPREFTVDYGELQETVDTPQQAQIRQRLYAEIEDKIKRKYIPEA